MRSTDFLAIILSLFNLSFALPTLSPSASPLPLIIWHGLGDRYDADGLSSVAELASQVHPGTYVYTIRLDDDGATDQRSTFWGNLSSQVDSVCTTLSLDSKLNSTRVDALGFSQGGQFLRGLIERCPAIRVRSLVTFGSQHNGIAKFQECGTWDLLCKGAIAAVRGNAWSDFVQSSIVPAQYYREIDPETGLGSEDYLKASNFLADVNNERENKTKAYKARLASLDKFVMYIFDEDTTVLPKESGWFAEVNVTDGKVTKLQDRKMYKEDWLGLKILDDKGALEFLTTPGRHMELSEKLLNTTFKAYYGPDKKGALLDAISGWRLQNALSSYELR